MPLAPLRQWPALLVIVALVALAGCQAGGPPIPSKLSEDAKFSSAIVADEALAVIAAREMLATGGSAADAAVALTFVLAVTYPSVASLGGGGQCLVYVPGQDHDTIQALDFLTRRVASPAGGRSAIAVPGTVRGMDALQTRFGRFLWSRTLAAAEQLARHGHPTSRLLAHALATEADTLFRDPAARALFSGGEGQAIDRGETLIQRDLAALIARLRQSGAADFYTGSTARLLEEAVHDAGGALAAADLELYQARWRDTVFLPFDGKELHTMSGSGGAVATAIWGLASADGLYREADGAKRLQLLVAAVKEGFATPVGDAPTTSFVIVDRRGMAVACGLTMNGPFGAGRVAPETGIVLAAAPEPDLAPPLASAMLIDRNSQQVFLTAAVSGGRAAPSALASVLLELLDRDQPLAAALAVPRVHAGGAIDQLDVEPAIGAEARSALTELGYRIVQVPAVGRVNAIHCPGGLPQNSESCNHTSDSRKLGVAADGNP